MTKLSNQKGFTLIEIIIASLIMTLIIAAVVKYHSSAGVSKGQEYYLKAVKVARAEMEKLRSLYELDSGIREFEHTGSPPDDIFLFKYNIETGNLDLPSPLFHVYYDDHGYSADLLKPLGVNGPYQPDEMSGVSFYHHYYCETFNDFSDNDNRDRKTFTYFIHDTNNEYPPDSDCTPCTSIKCQLDASLAVIDDMGSPYDCEDDLLGNIGWWIVDDGIISGVTHLKKVTFALQFWYPGQEWMSVDPEVIVIKTTLMKP